MGRLDQAVKKLSGAPEFPWHQDNGYTGLEVPHLQLWVALTAMDASNGGLVVAPGGHRQRATHRWVGDHAVMDPPPRSVEIEAAPGDALLFSSKLPHMTLRNTSGRERLAYVAKFLPLDVADRSIDPPHLVISRRGHPEGRFEDLSARWSPVSTTHSEELDVSQ